MLLSALHGVSSHSKQTKKLSLPVSYQNGGFRFAKSDVGKGGRTGCAHGQAICPQRCSTAKRYTSIVKNVRECCFDIIRRTLIPYQYLVEFLRPTVATVNASGRRHNMDYLNSASTEYRRVTSMLTSYFCCVDRSMWCLTDER